MSKENCGCGHDHAHDYEHNHEECGCGCGHDHEEALVITLDDGKGNEEQCIVIDSFEYEENEYLLAQSQKDESVYLFKMVGEELVYPEEEEFNKVTTYYNEVLVQQD